MLLRIDIKAREWYFFWNGNKIDLLASWYYKTNILPCKTTILWMLCFYYGIDFNKKHTNWELLKDIFIDEFEYWILNNTKSVDLLRKKYSSSFHRTKWDRKTQLYSKEYILNLDFSIYILFNKESLLLKYIDERKNFIPNIPWVWDKNLYPDKFDVVYLQDNYEKTISFHWKLLTNNFILSDYIIWVLWNINKKISLYSKRNNFKTIDEKIEIISWFWWIGDNNFFIEGNIVLYQWKWIILI